MDEKQLILEIIQSVEPRLIWGLILLCIAITIGLAIKGYLESIVAQHQFSDNRQLGANCRVRIRGKEGTIISYDRKWIIIRVSDGVELVNMLRWKHEQWAVLYNGGRWGTKEQGEDDANME